MNCTVLEFVDESPIIKVIVKALQKAYGIDYRQLRENDEMVAHMYTGFWKICRFDTNLTEMLKIEGIEAACFYRRGWKVYFVVDHQNRRTFNIISKETLKRVRRKRGGKIPHYARTFLYVENSDVQAINHQITLFDYGVEGTELDDFTNDEFLNDYDRITEGIIEPNVHYDHFIIVYEANEKGIKDCSIKYFNPIFEVAEELPLMKFIEPDYTTLTAPPEPLKEPTDKGSAVVRLKAGLEKRYEQEPNKKQTTLLRKKEQQKDI